MRLITLAILLALQPALNSKGQRPLPENAAWTYGTFAWFVGQYYVTHRTWPASEEQLRAESARFAAKELRTEERKGLTKIWASFTHIEFKPRGKDLLVITRFRVDGRDFKYDAIFHPRRSAEEIVDSITSSR
jgi:hypothetical protein